MSLMIFRKIKKIAKKEKGIEGILVFGSFLKKKQANDIDLLIIKNKIPNNSLEWAKKIVDLKKKIGIKKLDLQLIEKKRFLANLESHNPFYLDLAFDSKILYGEKFLKPKFREICKYVYEKGIKRDEKKRGWDFPVNYRKISFLSKVTNYDRAMVWLNEAIRDYQTAGLILKKIPERSITHSQQAIEKAIKAILICWGSFKGIHKVGEILEDKIKKEKLPKKWKQELKKLAEFSLILEPEFAKTRYPEVYFDERKKFWIPMEQYTEKDAKDFFKLVTQGLKIAQKFIQWWFKKSN